jgi:hypothetical protein
MAIQQTASAAEQFIADLYSDSALQEALYSIPELFINQAREGYDKFFVDTTAMSRRAYMREDGSCDLFRVVLEDPILYDNSTVSVKVRFSGIMDGNGEMVPHRAGATLQPGQKRLGGFRSTPVVFSPASVEEGLISQADLDTLVAYAEMWEDMIADFGESAMYTTERANKRLWIVADNADGLVTFDMTLRQNPSTKKPVIGIENVAWDNCSFIGVGTGAAQQQPAARAAAPVALKPTVKLPKLDRKGGNGNGGAPGVTRRRTTR